MSCLPLFNNLPLLFFSFFSCDRNRRRRRCIQRLIISQSRAAYNTARISRSRFPYSYGLPQSRSEIHPPSLQSHDLYTVKAGPFTLLANFSVSMTARPYLFIFFAKEFCITKFNRLVFSPETSQSYAFINGNEIISVPPTVFY